MALRHIFAAFSLVAFVAISVPDVPAVARATAAPMVEPADGDAVTVSGYLRDANTDAPIPGGRVTLGGQALRVAPDGTIPAQHLPVAAFQASAEAVVVASAPGYRDWTFDGIRPRADTPIELDLKLLRRGDLPPRAAQGTAEPGAGAPGSMAAALSTMPDRIVIGRTYTNACLVPTPYTYIPTEELSFYDYTRNVLPNEWIPTWPAASLEAGAVAVKQYAWYSGFIARKWRRQGYNFDLLDNGCDQFFKSNSAQFSTDTAIARTWNLALERDGQLFPTYFRAEDYQCPVALNDCMGQWGSYYGAQAGWSAEDILLYYYDPSELVTLYESRSTCDQPPAAPTPAPPSSGGRFHVYLPLIRGCGD